MIDVETIQKINNTSKELKNFGFSDSVQDSITQAQSIHTDSDKVDLVFGEQNDAIEALSYNFKKYKDITNNQIQSMGEQIETLQQYVKQLLQQMNSMKSTPSPQPSRQEYVAQKTVEQPITQQSSLAPVQQPIQSPAEKEEKPAEKPYYEKQGNFTSNDVKIEDIFYYGNKNR